MGGILVRFEKKLFEEEQAGGDENSPHAIDEKIVSLIKENPKATILEIATHLSISKRSAERIIKKLVDQKRIKKQGSKKQGEWILIEH